MLTRGDMREHDLIPTVAVAPGETKGAQIRGSNFLTTGGGRQAGSTTSSGRFVRPLCRIRISKALAWWTGLNSIPWGLHGPEQESG